MKLRQSFEGLLSINLSKTLFPIQITSLNFNNQSMRFSNFKTWWLMRFKRKMESFLNIFNNAFKAHQLHSQHTIYIVEIESSIEQDWNKLIQAQKGFQKAKEKLMLIQGPIKKKQSDLKQNWSRKKKISWQSLNQFKANFMSLASSLQNFDLTSARAKRPSREAHPTLVCWKGVYECPNHMDRSL